MSITTFDTLVFANKLKKAGVNAEQAEAQAEAISDVMVTMIEDKLATKQDIKELESRLTMRIGTITAAGVALLSTLLVVLHIT